jgi:ISXO2 transposase-like protein
VKPYKNRPRTGRKAGLSRPRHRLCKTCFLPRVAKKLYFKRPFWGAIRAPQTLRRESPAPRPARRSPSALHRLIRYGGTRFDRQACGVADATFRGLPSAAPIVALIAATIWQLFKNSIRSTHIHVSQKYMQRYLSEFTFRANHRERENAMFDLLVGAL